MAEQRTGADVDRVACHLRSAIRVIALLTANDTFYPGTAWLSRWPLPRRPGE
jgi:hypothetical protein